MERQYLCFLTASDEAALLAAIDRLDPGLVVLGGRYVDCGDPAALLEAPERFRFVQALRSQRRLYLAHRAHARSLVLLPQEEGPRRGLFALAERRSEVMELLLPAPRHGRLSPARLAASVVDFEGYARVRKGAAFGRWVARTLRHLEGLHPRSSVEFVHVAPGALAFAAGGGRLTYLEEPVLPAPDGTRRQAALERIRG